MTKPGFSVTQTLAAVLIGLPLSLSPAPVAAQDAQTKTAPVQAPSSPSQAVLESWNDIGRKLTAMAEDFPEDKYDFKPNPAERSFAEQLLHAGGANYFFTAPAMGQKPPALEDPKRDQYKTKADVVAFVKKSFADGAQALRAKGDRGLNDRIVDPEAISRSASSMQLTKRLSTPESITGSW